MPITKTSRLPFRLIRSFLSRSDSRLLCLWCGRIGHKPSRCRKGSHRRPEKETLEQLVEEGEDLDLCGLCELRWPGIIALFARDDPHLPSGPSSSRRRTRKTYNLGPVVDVVLYADCPLCRLIFVLSPWYGVIGKKHFGVRLVQAWTPERLGLSAHDVDQIQSYSTCVISKLYGISTSEGLSSEASPSEDSSSEGSSPIFSPFLDDHSIEVQEAVVTIPATPAPPEMLCGRQVNPNDVDVDIIKSWLRRCEVHHTRSCTPAWEEAQRQMKFIDVNSCQVVSYPAVGRVDYTALSYVWGDSTGKAHQVGSKVLDAPKTITDAITMTRRLGKDFLWVDAICIDQDDDRDLSRQLGLMQAIYGGAWVTLIALAGKDARSGLPRVSSSSGRASNSGHAQWTCSHAGITLATVLRTLKAHESSSKWATRGWTFQEALLSPRCLYFTEEQAYYQCNVLQTCESLHDSDEHPHSMRDSGEDSLKQQGLDLYGASLSATSITTVDMGHSSQLLDAPRNLRAREIELSIDDGLRLYDKLLKEYSSKFLSWDEDSIRAFSGILDRLQERYLPSGFLWGIPRDYFKRCLLWSHFSLLSYIRRRPGFPSWSWAGWEGQVDYGEDKTYETGQPYVQFFEIKDGRRVPAQVYPKQEASPFPPDYTFTSKGETVFRATRVRDSAIDSVDLDQAERDGMLLVDGILLRVYCGSRASIRRRKMKGSSEERTLDVCLRDITCVRLDSNSMDQGVYDCLLVGLASNEYPRETRLDFIMLSWDGEIAHRAGFFTIQLPDGLQQEGLQFRLRTFFLG